MDGGRDVNGEMGQCMGPGYAELGMGRRLRTRGKKRVVRLNEAAA